MGSNLTAAERAYVAVGNDSGGTAAYLEVAVRDFEEKWKNPTKNNAVLADFTIRRTLGAGAYGRVVLTMHNSTEMFYATKILEKKKLVKMGQVDHALNEKQILQAINFRFLIRLAYSFKDTTNVYFVLEMMPGGDLFSYHRKVRKFGEPQAKLYGAQVVLAFEYLHAMDIIYRDLKPENIMIDQFGYLKVIDMGFAKRVKTRTYTMCGTPDYIAPEIIQSKGYSKAVDWWTLGILLFEMASGQPPFQTPEPLSLYQKIIIGKFKTPPHFTDELRHLCKCLINVDLTRRYGNLRGGVDDIKRHAWFHEIQWAHVYYRRYRVPFEPAVKTLDDTRNFGKMAETPLLISPQDLYTKEFMDF